MSSMYSDGGPMKDEPPTPQDYMMRKKHASDSVEYNLEHAEDHLAELTSQMGILYGVSRGEASKLAHKVCKYLDKVYDDLEKYKLDEGHNHHHEDEY